MADTGLFTGVSFVIFRSERAVCLVPTLSGASPGPWLLRHPAVASLVFPRSVAASAPRWFFAGLPRSVAASAPRWFFAGLPQVRGCFGTPLVLHQVRGCFGTPLVRRWSFQVRGCFGTPLVLRWSSPGPWLLRHPAGSSPGPWLLRHPAGSSLVLLRSTTTVSMHACMHGADYILRSKFCGNTQAKLFCMLLKSCNLQSNSYS